jgi:hypothetical protein
MRLDLAERLRCPRPHAATPLVVVTSALDGRDLRRAAVGCPMCRLEARIVEGDVEFDESSMMSIAAVADPEPDRDRLLALLGLAESGGSVLLTGRYTRVAEALARATEVAVVAMFPAQPLAADELVATVRGVDSAVPFTDATFRGAALDLSGDVGASWDAFARDAVRSVMIGGRVVGPSERSVPEGLTELARDVNEWVAERRPMSTPVPLRRR